MLQHKAAKVLRGSSPLQQLPGLVLHAGKAAVPPPEGGGLLFSPPPPKGQLLHLGACGKAQVQHLSHPVDKLPGADIQGLGLDSRGKDLLPAGGDAQRLKGAPRYMEGQKGPVQKLHPSGGPESGGNVPVLVGGGVKGEAHGLGHRLPHRLPRQKTGHIGIGEASGTVRNANRRRPFPLPLHQPFQHLRQLPDMMKKSITLPQAQLPLPHRKDFPAVTDSAAPGVVFGRRGGVIAGVNPQKIRPIQGLFPRPLARRQGSGRIRPAPR